MRTKTRFPKTLPRAALALALLALALSACVGKRPSTEKQVESIKATLAPAAPDELVIAATSDFHGALARAENLANIVDALREHFGDQLLYVDGGGLFGGGAETDMTKGGAAVDLYNILSPDAVAVGLQEFDYGPDARERLTLLPGEDGLGNLKHRMKDAMFQWLSANIVARSSQKPVFTPHAVFTRGSRKVCVTSVITPLASRLVSPMYVINVSFEDMKETVQAESKLLRDQNKCDTIVLLAHTRAPGEVRKLLLALPAHTVDAVVMGGRREKVQQTINDVPVIAAGKSGEAVGLLRLPKTGAPRFEPFVDVPDAPGTHPVASDKMEPYRKMVSEVEGLHVGKLKEPIRRDPGHESALGNLVADAVLAAGRRAEKADFALVSSKALHDDLPEGMITLGDVFKVMPFDSSLAVITIHGAELKRLLEIAFSGAHGMPSVAGLHIKKLDVPAAAHGAWDRDLNHDGKSELWERNVVVAITDDQGHALDDDKVYKLATLDFQAQGAEHQAFVYDRMPATNKCFHRGLWARDALLRYLDEQTDYDPKLFFDPQKRRVELVTVPAP